MSSVTATAPKDFPTLKKHRVAIENFMAFVEANKDGADLEFLNELMNAYIKEEIPNIEKAKKSTRKKTFWDTYRTIRSTELMDEYDKMDTDESWEDFISRQPIPNNGW